MAQHTARHKIKADTKLPFFLSLLATIWITTSYLTASKIFPTFVILAVASQVLARGVQAMGAMIMVLSSVYASRKERALPIDFFTAFVIDMGTRLGGPANPHFLIWHGFVALGLTYTPEVLLTSFGDRTDTRAYGAYKSRVELASFGGGKAKDTFYTSGVLLLASQDPVNAYQEVAYSSGDDWIIPRKPTALYTLFGENKTRRNDQERRVHVEKNEAVSIRKVDLPENALRYRVRNGSCEPSRTHSFGYSLIFYTCKDWLFGFEFLSDVEDIDGEMEMFSIRKGVADVMYTSRGGWRRMEGTPLGRGSKQIKLPRTSILWNDMGHSFLNMVSFNRPTSDRPTSDRPTSDRPTSDRPTSELSVPLKLALSSIVRSAGIEAENGFSDPPSIVDATVWEVKVAIVSRWVIVTVTIALTIEFISLILCHFCDSFVCSELLNLIIIGSETEFVQHLHPSTSTDSSDESEQFRFRKLTHSFWVYFSGSGESTRLHIVDSEQSKVDSLVLHEEVDESYGRG